MFKIMGQNRNGVIEEIDESDTEINAEYLVSEYNMDFGVGWIIWIEEK